MQSRVSNERYKQLTEALRPKWQPNERIKMFHEERAKVEQRGLECKTLLSETDHILRKALTLVDLYSFIAPKTSQLHSECKTLIQERNDLSESYKKINQTLSKQEELRGIFKRMPEIKNQVFAILNSVSQSFQSRNQPSQTANDITPLEEYYGRFYVECRRIKDLTLQLESCLSCANTEELAFYLEEIYGLYVDIREQLMGSLFSINLEKLVARANRNYCDLLQQSCASLVRIIRNEIQLFYQVFPSVTVNVQSTDHESSVTAKHKSQPSPQLAEATTKGSDAVKKHALSGLLSLLCKTFYEHMRPVIIHVNHLETLAELYKLINETIRFECHEEPFISTIDNLSEDIQERLAFRTEVFIQESILDYKPSQGDLAYPEKFDLIPGGDLNDYQSMWYPTVQRTVLTLLYLKRVFDDLTFNELAQDLVAACYKSLDFAQNLVDQQHGGSKVEASVFMSKHSAIIVNQLRNYGIDQSSLVPPPPLLAYSNPDDVSPESKQAELTNPHRQQQ